MALSRSVYSLCLSLALYSLWLSLALCIHYGSLSSLLSLVTVFSESLPLDSSDNMASQSVPMVTNSGGMGAGDDEVFMEQEGEG